MIRLYEGSGSTEIQVLEDRFLDRDWQRLKAKACEFLNLRGQSLAAEFLAQHNFECKRATNGFGDEFCILFERLRMDAYVEALELVHDMQVRASARAIANAVGEIAHEYVRFVALELDDTDTPLPVSSPVLEITSATVERALADAERLIETQGSTSGVDRVHTAFHGYLRALASRSGIPYADSAGVTELYKLLRTQHPDLAATGTNQAAIDKITKSLASIVDALNPLRNHSSIAHANDSLLEDPEAMLVINSVRTLLHYLNARTKL